MTVQLNAAEIAAFAVDVFDDVNDIARRLPPGFVRLTGLAGASGEGFEAVAYFNAATGQLVVAYRADESLRSEFTNLSFVASGSDTAFERALAFADAARASVAAAGGIAIDAGAVMFTGHGVGGGLAALVAGSDSAAIGGDLAYRYGLGGGLSGVAVSAVQQIIGDSGFGASAQDLHSLDSLTQGAVKLG